jgi:preprotein translocase subunit SecA
VTIATNMAGRGTDIVLGGAAVRALGGLYVIATNRHESRRIDNQLRGRSGRQGDPGASVLYISLEDDLMVRYGIEKSMAKYRLPGRQETAVKDPILERIVAHIQRVIEGQNYDIRRNLYKYTHFIDKQRRIIFDMRGRILLSPTAADSAETTGFLAAERPKKRQQALDNWGAAFTADLERRLRLQAIDAAWSEHLETVSEIRDGIHLMEIGGLSPVNEFHKQAKTAFEAALDSIDDRLLEAFDELAITAEPPDYATLGLLGPASTWTYLIHDHSMSNPILRALRRFGIG